MDSCFFQGLALRACKGGFPHFEMAARELPCPYIDVSSLVEGEAAANENRKNLYVAFIFFDAELDLNAPA